MDELPQITAEKLKVFLHNGVDQFAEQMIDTVNAAASVMVPWVTEAEKVQRRKKVVERRRRSGKTCLPLPPRRRGAARPFQEFKTVVFYDEHGEHWHEVLSGNSRTPSVP
jgi:hypothetical protein